MQHAKQKEKENKTKTHLTASCISHLGPIYFTTLKKKVATHHTAWEMVMYEWYLTTADMKESQMYVYVN